MSEESVLLDNVRGLSARSDRFPFLGTLGFLKAIGKRYQKIATYMWRRNKKKPRSFLRGFHKCEEAMVSQRALQHH